MRDESIHPSESYSYGGNELSLFQEAHHWKRYVRAKLSPYIHGRVLEVGAGIGGTTQYLAELGTHWLSLEPDAVLAAQIAATLSQHAARERVRIHCGTLDSLGQNDTFDTILYIDVLEHIENDKREILSATSHLAAEGRLIVLSPAHPFLFTPFDAHIGHYRRYNKKSLGALIPPSLYSETVQYLDSVGLLASLGNRLLLKSSMPTAAQIALWDRCMVPVSSYLDAVFGYALGKTIVGVWRLT